MKLFVVRHGETENNLKKVVQGITDSPLTEKGILKAQDLQTVIDAKKIDYVVSSPLKRAYDTALIITDGKIPINKDDRLIERDWGLCEQVSILTVDRVKCWNYYLNTNANSIEPVQEFVNRIREFIWELKINQEHKNVLVVAHSAVSRAIYYIVHGIPDDGDMTKLKIPNLSILEYEL